MDAPSSNVETNINREKLYLMVSKEIAAYSRQQTSLRIFARV